MSVHFQFLKKFLHYSKHRIHPELTEDAREHISSAYASLRSKQVSSVPAALYFAMYVGRARLVLTTSVRGCLAHAAFLQESCRDHNSYTHSLCTKCLATLQFESSPSYKVVYVFDTLGRGPLILF